MRDLRGVSGYVGRMQVVIDPCENIPCWLPGSISGEKGRRDGVESPRALLGYWEVNGTSGRREELPRQSLRCFPGTAAMTHGIRSQVCRSDSFCRFCFSGLDDSFVSQRVFWGVCLFAVSLRGFFQRYHDVFLQCWSSPGCPMVRAGLSHQGNMQSPRFSWCSVW